MKTTAPLAILLALLLSAGAPATADTTHAKSASRDIVSTAVADGRFQTLATALTKADLVGALRGEGPFTVFAPTDDAFAALPEGTLALLLKRDNKRSLQRVLGYHVVSGKVMAGDLLKATSADTLADTPLAIGLRVDNANVIEADIECSNGVIHVIDRVLLPKPKVASAHKKMPLAFEPMQPRLDVREVLTVAINKGAPIYNDGHPERCAEIYHEAAERLMNAGDSLSEWDRMQLRSAMTKRANDASERAWNLREAFDEILTNEAFEPLLEASLPKGFPKPGPVGRVSLKRYPNYRAARAEGRNSFWTLFNHIKKNNVEMTAPVEMTMDADMRMRDMAFLYEGPEQGKAGRQGSVEVLDLDSMQVLSIGIRGRRDSRDIERAKGIIEARMKMDGWESAGDWRVLGYNSPMVPASKQYWELQIPVRK